MTSNYATDLSKNEFEVHIDQHKLKTLAINHAKAKEGWPTLIFLHDSLGCIVLWRSFPDQLVASTACNALIYDRCGYGQSSPFVNKKRTKAYLEEEADTLHSFLEKCGIKNAILFGHSDGGSIALIAAAKYPSQIKGVITEGAHVFVEEVTLRGIEAAVKSYASTNLKQKLEKYHGTKTNNVFKAWTNTWLSDDYRYWNIEHFLPNISCPALIIQGKDDEYGTEAQVESIASGTKGNAIPLIIPGIGHTPHREAHKATLNASTSFILSCIDCGG